MEVNKPRFFDSVNYEKPQTLGEKFANAAENYVEWGNRKFTVMPKKGDPKTVEFTEEQHEMWSTAKKVAVSVTLILPLILFIGKLIFRAIHTFVKKVEASKPEIVQQDTASTPKKTSLFGRVKKGAKNVFKSDDEKAIDHAKDLKDRVTEQKWVLNEFGGKKYIFSKGEGTEVKVQRVEKFLGDGTYGQVYKLKDLKSKKFTALKLANRDDQVGILRKEVGNLEKINSTAKGILGIQGKPFGGLVEIVEEKDKTLYAYESELYDGSLKSLIKDKNLSKDERLNIAKQIVDGMAHLHKHGWFHGDIATKNILYKLEDGQYKVAIIDLAGATKNPAGEKELMTTEANYPQKERDAAASSGKTDNFKQIEMYALGKVLCRLLGVIPASAARNKEELIKVLDGNEELADTIVRMLSPTTEKKVLFSKEKKTVWNRPTIKEVQAAFRK